MLTLKKSEKIYFDILKIYYTLKSQTPKKKIWGDVCFGNRVNVGMQ